MHDRLGLMTALLTLGAFDVPRYRPSSGGKMRSYSDPKRQGQFEKKQAKSKRRKEIAKASRRKNRRK